MPVPLTDYATEPLLDSVREVAAARLSLARSKGRTQPFGDPGDKKRAYVDGYSCLAEALVASWLGIRWVSEIIEDLSTKPPDVGNRTEVRWTSHRPGHLIAHETDTDGWFMILVRGELPEIEVAGWTMGSTAKQPVYQGHAKARSPHDFWFPASDLLMADMLPQIRASL